MLNTTNLADSYNNYFVHLFVFWSVYAIQYMSGHTE